MRRISKARWKGKWDRQDPTTLIQKYIKPGTFFHMSDLGPGASNTDRFGINPKQGWDTPFGIYGYPLDREYSQHLIKGTLPFRSEAPWVHVFKVALSKCVIASKYSSSQYQRDYEVLIKRAGVSNQAELENADKSAYVQTPAGKLWNVTRVLALVESTGNPILRWNRIFRDLGYESFWDDGCQGIIHKNERCQIVVFATNYAKRLDVIPNPSNDVGYRQYTKPPKPDLSVLKGWQGVNDSFWQTLFVENVGLVEFSVDMKKFFFMVSVELVNQGRKTFTLDKSLTLTDSFYRFPMHQFSKLPTLLDKALGEVRKKGKSPDWKFIPTSNPVDFYASYAFRKTPNNGKYFVTHTDVGKFFLLSVKGYGYSIGFSNLKSETLSLNSSMRFMYSYSTDKPEDFYFFSRKRDAVSYMKKWREKEVARLKDKHGTSL